MKELLNLYQTEQVLNAEVYGQDYYWYLRSETFQKAFLRPLGSFINAYVGNSDYVVDVGCGEGQLFPFIRSGINYRGFDACPLAINKARKDNEFSVGFLPGQVFQVARLENPPSYDGPVKCVVMGGLLSVIVLEDKYPELFRMYRNTYGCRYVFVYDLESTNLQPLEKIYRKVLAYHCVAELPSLPMVKRKRKIVLFDLENPK